MKCRPYLVLPGDHGVPCAGVSAKHVPGSGPRWGGYTQNWLSRFGAADSESQPCSPSVPTWSPYQTDFTSGISVPLTLKHSASKINLILQWLYALAPGKCTLAPTGAGEEDKIPGQDPPSQFHFLSSYSTAALPYWKKEHTARFLQSLRKHNLNVFIPLHHPGIWPEEE